MAAGHLLFIAPSAYPLGGVATWLSYIVPGLRAAGWDVTLGLVQGRFHDVDAYLAVHPDAQVLRIPYGTGTQEGRIRRLIKTIRDAHPDIVVAVNIGEVAAAMERMRIKSKWSPRLVVTLHGMLSDYTVGTGRWTDAADGVICTNRLARPLIVKAGKIEAGRIYYAPYGVDIPSEAFAGRPADARRTLQIGVVGRLEDSQKRVRDLAAIVRELERRNVDYKLEIAGGGPDEGWLSEELSDITASGRVRFLGTLSGPQLVAGVYRCVDAVLITSSWETGPIVAWEAMAHGAPVVSSRYIGSGREGSLVDGENCLMFPVGDTSAAVDCLERLFDHRLRKRLRDGGARMVAERYSKPASVGQWDASLRAVLKQPARTLGSNRARGYLTPRAGRLDRLLGTHWGEDVRQALGLSYAHVDAGGEWPHMDPSEPVNEAEFWAMAGALDRSVLETAG